MPPGLSRLSSAPLSQHAYMPSHIPMQPEPLPRDDSHLQLSSSPHASRGSNHNLHSSSGSWMEHQHQHQHQHRPRLAPYFRRSGACPGTAKGDWREWETRLEWKSGSVALAASHSSPVISCSLHPPLPTLLPHQTHPQIPARTHNPHRLLNLLLLHGVAVASWFRCLKLISTLPSPSNFPHPPTLL